MEKTSLKKRNSLIEFYRFFFAMNVLICHGFFPVEMDFFGPDRISVEFFFVLSGYLFYHLFDRLCEMKTLEAVRFTLRAKLNPLLVPLLIGMASNAVLNVLSDHKPKIEVFRYLWYIPAMLAILLLYAVLSTLIKNRKVFFIVIASLFVIATLLRFSGNRTLFFFDYIRSTSAVSLGILVAWIPKLPLRKKNLLWCVLLPLIATVFLMIFFHVAEENVGYEALLDLVLYPLLVYLTFHMDFHFVPFDILGALSFGIYAFQSPARLLDYIGTPSPWIPFGLIFVAAITEYLIRILIVKKRAEKKQ